MSYRLDLLPDGRVAAVYADALLPLLQRLGTVDVQRLSDVEYLDGAWCVQARPAAAQVLAPLQGQRFQRRQDALAAEIAALTTTRTYGDLLS